MNVFVVYLNALVTQMENHCKFVPKVAIVLVLLNVIG